MQIREYKETDREDLKALWKVCNLIVPWNDPDNDIDAKISFQADLLVVALLNEKLIGSVMIGYEGHRGHINYLAVHPDQQGFGIGKKIMEYAELILIELGCPKINLMVRTSNVDVINFYKTIGYKQDDVICLGKRID